MADDQTRPDVATFGAPVPPRRRRWSILVALLLVVGLGAWLTWKWPTRQEMVRDTAPETYGIGTAGDRIPGATAGPPASDRIDPKAFPVPSAWDPDMIVAYLGRQPVYLVGSKPESIPDSNMVTEATTDKGKIGAGYHLYVPKDWASGSEVSARYYYLRLGPNQYARVSPKRANP